MLETLESHSGVHLQEHLKSCNNTPRARAHAHSTRAHNTHAHINVCGCWVLVAGFVLVEGAGVTGMDGGVARGVCRHDGRSFVSLSRKVLIITFIKIKNW